MSFDEAPLVGSASARALRGPVGDLDALLLGPGDGAHVAAALAPFGGRVLGRSAPAHPVAPLSPSRSAALEEPWSELVVAAEAAEQHDDRPLVVTAADLRLSSVALLDLLDGPARSTATVVLDPAQVVDASPLATVSVARTRRVTAAGAGAEVVPHATGYAVGLLRIDGPDRPAAARLWRAAAEPEQRVETAVSPELADVSPGVRAAGVTTGDGAGPVHPVDGALRALVQGGLEVTAAPLGLYEVSRGATRLTFAAGGPWQQRLRTSSRGNDSPFSKAVIRPLSRRLTAVGLRRDWTPNAVTGASLMIGLAAAAIVLVDTRWAWIAAAVLLQLSLVVDCVDGEIARFTRTYSPLGAWLDGVSDRVKEFAVIGTVTAVGLRTGHDLWGLAIALVAVLTIRQVEDQGYSTRLRLADAATAREPQYGPPAASAPPSRARPVGRPGRARSRP